MSGAGKRCFVGRPRGPSGGVGGEIDRVGTRGECKSMSCWELSGFPVLRGRIRKVVMIGAVLMKKGVGRLGGGPKSEPV